MKLRERRHRRVGLESEIAPDGSHGLVARASLVRDSHAADLPDDGQAARDLELLDVAFAECRRESDDRP